mmetsp:Transcript_4442/g.13474  ORF Transcript_4442/g.13474 Transcript_4442/m.13474 type:complete len:743 (+) Transcript_4442:166-2394(+)
MDIDIPGQQLGDGFRPPSPPTINQSRKSRGVANAESRIASDPWDWEAWQSVLADAQSLPFLEAQPVFERVVAQFPSYARAWKQYAESAIRRVEELKRALEPTPGTSSLPSEMMPAAIVSVPEDQQPDTIFERAFHFCKTSVDLWRFYLSYARSCKTRDEITRAYERALSHCGLEPSSYMIWRDYIDFIAQSPASGSAEEQHRREHLRKVYQRAVKSPIQNLDTLWRQYEEFENEGMNQELARGIIQEIFPLNKNARAEFRARKHRREGLVLNAPACPPRGKPKEAEQSKLWRKYISGEKANTNELPPEELYRRVSYAYELALACLYRYPDAWIEAANYQKESDQIAEAETFLTRGIEALSTSALLHFALANLYELNDRAEQARKCFENLIQTAPSPLAYIQYMRFARRSDGIDAARRVFARARKDQHCCTFQIFVAAAQLEYHVNKLPKIAKNIFELGMKLFPTSVDYAMEFIQFLWYLNDDSMIRSLFEQVLSQLPKGIDSRVVWEKYVEFECVFGSAESVDKVVKRMSASLDNGPSEAEEVISLIKRNTAMDLIPVTYQEMNSVQSRVGTASVGPGENERPDRSTGGSGGKESKQRAERDNQSSNDRGRNSNQPLGLEEGLRALGNMFPKPPTQSAPPVEMVIQLIMSTPQNFSDTPAGNVDGPSDQTRPANEGDKSHDKANGGTNGRKRKGEDSDNKNREGQQNANPGEPINVLPTPVHRPPSGDLFRSRQAQKLSKSK